MLRLITIMTVIIVVTVAFSVFAADNINELGSQIGILRLENAQLRLQRNIAITLAVGNCIILCIIIRKR